MKIAIMIGGFIFAAATINTPILSIPTAIGSVILLLCMTQ